jgi:hypothetical protein
MSITAMKQALEALKLCPAPVFLPDRNKREAAIAALRTAIEAAEKPVAWGMKSLGGDFIIDCITPEEHAREEGGYNIPLYTTPPATYPEFECPRCGHYCARGQA